MNRDVATCIRTVRTCVPKKVVLKKVIEWINNQKRKAKYLKIIILRVQFASIHSTLVVSLATTISPISKWKTTNFARPALFSLQPVRTRGEGGGRKHSFFSESELGWSPSLRKEVHLDLPRICHFKRVDGNKSEKVKKKLRAFIFIARNVFVALTVVVAKAPYIHESDRSILVLLQTPINTECGKVSG